jgi:RND family efflux transporter MFP subunit
MNRRFSFAFVLTASVAAVVYFVGVRPRLHATAALDERTQADSHPAVNLIVAHPGTTATELVLPATLRAFQDTGIFARTDGYLAKWSADIGDHVKAGQTLATLDAPELQQSLEQARANLAQAKANLEIARLSAERWKALGQQSAVAQQDVDQKNADFAARQADVLAAEANVQRLSQLESYLTISAPFDGVITARNAEVGMLVSAGAARELFHLAQTDTLRVYVDVPQTYYRAIHADLAAEVLVGEFPGKAFAGKVARAAGALDATTRTLRTEVELPNTDGRLLAGMFGQVRFHLPASAALVVPSNVVIIRADGTLVAVVDATNTVHLKQVKLGRDFGTSVEILSGIDAGTPLVANPSDALTDGTVVSPIAPPSVAKK